MAKFSSNDFEIAQRAVDRFKSMLITLNGFCQALSGNKNLTIEISPTNGGTDGKKIYFSPPIELGHDYQHNSMLCDKRDDSEALMCPACRTTERIMATIYHELAHLIFNSFTPVTRTTVEQVNAAANTSLPWQHDLLAPVLMTGISPDYTKHLFNTCEDNRINADMFKARPGVAAMYESMIKQVAIEGIPNPREPGKYSHWRDMQADMQIIMGMNVLLAGFDYEGWLHPEIEADLANPDLIAFLNFGWSKVTDVQTCTVFSVKLYKFLQTMGYFEQSESEDSDEQGSGDDGSDSQEQQSDGSSSEASSGSSSSSSGSGSDSSPSDASSSDSDSSESSKDSESEQRSADEDSNETDDNSESTGDGELESEDGNDDGQDNSDTEQESGGSDNGDSDQSQDDTDSGDNPGSQQRNEPSGNEGDAKGDNDSSGQSGETQKPESIKGDYSREADWENFKACLQDLIMPDGSHSHDEQREPSGAERALSAVLQQGGYFDTFSPHVPGVSFAPLHHDQPLATPVALIGKSVQQMRIALEENRRAKNLINVKSGKIRTSALGKRAAVNDPRMMRKKIIPGKRDYFFCIMSDWSGSYYGHRVRLQQQLLTAEGDTLNRLGIKFEVYGHSSDAGNRMLIWNLKELSDPWDVHAKGRIAAMDSNSENFDGHAIEFARKRMDEVMATDKIILYHTDGMMPAANGTEELQIMQREFKICHRSNYTILGVGMNTDSPRQHGLETVQVDSQADLGKVIKMIASKIK